MLNHMVAMNLPKISVMNLTKERLIMPGHSCCESCHQDFGTYLVEISWYFTSHWTRFPLGIIFVSTKSRWPAENLQGRIIWQDPAKNPFLFFMGRKSFKTVLVVGNCVLIQAKE